MKSVRFACWFVLVSTMVLAQSNPTPLVNQPLVPLNAAPGGLGFTLTVNGTGFIAASTVEWNGSPRATTFVSGSQLTASINSADIATAGSFAVTVVNPGPGGGTSNVASFQVTTTSSSFGLLKSSLATSGVAFPVVADFNGDGDLDVAVLESNATAVLVFLGNGNGTFQTSLSSTLAPQPQSMVAGDFNHDGIPDLAITNNNGTVSVVLGKGDGTFGPRVDYPAGRDSIFVATADFNGDGNLDLAVANLDSRNVSILLGNGTGTFQSHVDYRTDDSPISLAVGDFNGDGKLDLAAATQQTGRAVTILIGNGDGSFQSAPSLTGLTSAPTSLVAADFNGDGRVDLVVGTTAVSYAVFLGKGDGSFRAPMLGTGAGVHLVTGDFNGDGKLDLLASGPSQDTIALALGNGDGTFQKARKLFVGENTPVLAVGDFNGDGLPDVAGIGTSASINILLQTTAKLGHDAFNFKKEMVGSQSLPLEVALTNFGGSPLLISSIVASANFAQTNTCGSMVPPRRRCTIEMTFVPTQTGFLSGTITITDNAAGSPQIIVLHGNGVAPAVTLSPTSLTFDSQKVGTTSAPQNVTLTNTGTATLTFTSVAASGDFAQTNTCGSQLLIGQACTIIVTFTPTQAGTRTGAVTLTDDALDTPQTVPLTGTGTP